MRSIILLLASFLLVACTSHSEQNDWKQRLARYVAGDDAQPLIDALEAAHYPRRDTPNLPTGESHCIYFLPNGVIHVMESRASDSGKSVISAPPFFLPDDSPVSERLERVDKAWDDYVRTRTAR